MTICQLFRAILSVYGIGLLFVTNPVEPAGMTGEQKILENLKIGD
jgi:hypothetical protein